MGLNNLIKATKRELLVTPLHEAWLMANSNVELDDDIARWVARELIAKQRNRTQTWSSSSLGSCQRKHIYQYLGAPLERGVTSELSAIFQHGTWTHLKWQASGYMAGWLAQTEVFCSMPEFGFTGTIDGILTDGSGWELKSINNRGFTFVLRDGPKHEHLKQIHGYMLATGIRVWSLMYENKDTQDYKEFVVHFDDAIAMEVELELQALNTAVVTQTLPPMLPGCIAKTSAQYRSCPFQKQCEESRWPNRNTLRIRKSSSSTS